MTYSITNNTVDTISISLNDLDSEINTNSASGTFSITGNTSPYDYNYTWNSASPLITTGTDTITLGNWNNVSVLDVNGDANFEGDVKIKGKSILESLEKIEEKLAILHPNVELEKKWEQLRELRKQYMELEKEIIEKEKVWDILKK